MITFNKIKSLLDQGILPCLINSNGNIDYILGYHKGQESFITLNGIVLQIENGQLSLVINEGGENLT